MQNKYCKFLNLLTFTGKATLARRRHRDLKWAFPILYSCDGASVFTRLAQAPVLAVLDGAAQGPQPHLELAAALVLLLDRRLLLVLERAADGLERTDHTAGLRRDTLVLAVPPFRAIPSGSSG